ncbi:MAG TPA: glycerophosphodiester phosphodiesterase [Caldilineae bacterium]|nr:glycerophosphodiester phosphodiesterase [Caldilineae bacterium]
MKQKLWRILAIIVGLLAAALLITAIWARPIADHPFYDQFSRWPLVIAHQGGYGLWPSNTMYAYERAVDMGVDMLEMDLHITADGALVLMHDGTVDRTTNGSGEIEDMTLAEIKQLDAGYTWTHDDGATYPFRGQGVTVPTMEEVFAAFPDMPMNIELKRTETSMAEPFCRLIHEHDMQNKVLVASFRDETMTEFRAVCPDVATSGSEGELTPFVLLSKVGLGWLFRPAANAVQVPQERGGIRILSKGFVRAAHGRNMKVDAWTINEREDMRRIIDMGVDGIITDYPDRLLAELGGS